MKQAPSQRKSAVVVTHVRGLGPSNHLERVLVELCGSVLAIDHPLIHSTPATSRFRLFENGRLVREGERSVSLPEPLRFVSDVILTVYWTARFARRSDVVVGVDALNCVAALVAKPFLAFKTVVFYVIDWSPRRFDNRTLNTLYHFGDRLAALLATQTWHQSHALDNVRWQRPVWREIGRLAQRRVRIVPNAVAKVDVDLPADARRPHRLVFMGHLLAKQGLQLAIAAMPQVLGQFPDSDLIVVGSGPYEAALRELACSLGVSSRVLFVGYVEDEGELLSYLRSAAVGLAPYTEEENSFTRFADPGKIKNYLAVGLPVIMTGLPYNAKDLEEQGCAILVDPSVESVARAICQLLGEDKCVQRERSEKARGAVRHLDWDSVFHEALAPLGIGLSAGSSER